MSRRSTSALGGPRSVPIACSLLLLAASSLSADEELPLRRGDTAVVVAPAAELRLGDKAVADLAPLERLRITEVRGSWVGVEVNIEGETKRGWVPRRTLARDRPADAGPPKYGASVLVKSSDVPTDEGYKVSVDLVSLVEKSQPPLSELEAEIVARAKETLRKAMQSDAEVFGRMLKIDSEQALAWCKEDYDQLAPEVRRQLAKAAADRKGPIAEALVLRALASDRRDVRERALGALDRDERLALGDAIIAACEKADAKQLPWLLEALGDEGTDQFLPALGEIAGRSERAVQAKAFERVALIGGEAATQILRVALDDPEAFKREVALRGLYKLGAISEDDALRAITDMEENLDYAAMKVIPSATDAKLRAIVDAALQSDADWRRTTAVSALGRFGYPDDVPRLVERLKTDSSERVREAAAKALAGHPAVSDFAPLLEAARAKDEKGSVDAAVGEALAATPAGVRAALDGNLIDQYRVWKAFVTALAGQEEPPFDALVEVGHLQTPEGITSEITSEQLAFACEKLEPAQKLELARLILERGGGLGQAKAIELLKGAGSAESAALLREACGFPNVLPHRHVRDGRRVIPSGTQAIIIATEVYGSIWELILRALDPSESEKRIVEGALVENARTAIKNSDPDIRAGAIRVLAHFAPDEHAVTLLDAAEDESWEVRKAVAEALAKLTADQAAPALVQLTEKSNEEVREAVAKTVVALGGDALRPLAEKLLDDSDSDVRAVAVGTIAHFPDLTPKAVDVAQELKLHRQQKLAVETFAGLAPEKAAAVLGQVAEEAETYNLSVKAIVKLLELTQNGALSVEGCANALAGVIQGDWRGPRVAAACGLASLGSPGGLPPLLKETEGGSLPVTLGAVLCTPDREKLSPSPSRVRLVGKILFGVGTEPMGFYSVTHSAHVPIRVRRRDDAFLYGDRWALDLQEKRDALRQDSLDPAVLALAAYEDPRAAEGIENALRSDEDAKRRAAVWALALKDRAGTLVRLLENEHEDVVEEALIALRLLGHRPAIRFLAEHCQNNVDAALAVLELTILADRERKRIFSE